jgi:hypothetical protein
MPKTNGEQKTLKKNKSKIDNYENSNDEHPKPFSQGPLFFTAKCFQEPSGLDGGIPILT